MRQAAFDRGGLTALVISMSAAMPIAAQFPELPTLSELGAEYISASGFFQISLSGQLDLEGFHVSDGRPPTQTGLDRCEQCHVDVGRHLREEDGTMRLHRLRLFTDIFLGDHVYTLVEMRRDNGGESLNNTPRVRLEQAFVRLSTGSGVTGVQLGRFASPFGSYTLRHLTTDDPFLRPPLAYDYRTVMNRFRVSPGPAGFLSWKDNPLDVDLPSSPQVWEVPYQWGAMAFGTVGPVSLTVAAMNSAPSSGASTWRWDSDRVKRASWIASARLSPSPSLDLGVSYNRGPWRESTRQGTILPPPGSPPGTTAPAFDDFDQELVSLDATFARGAAIVRAEVIHDRWEVPNLADAPSEMSYSLEAQYDLFAGFFVAARGGYIDFGEIGDGAGGRAEWDYDVLRYEGSVGYRLARNVGLLFSGLKQIQDGDGDGDLHHVGLRLWWAF